MDTAVKSLVLPVVVAEDARIEQRMVESGVKGLLLDIGAALHLDAAQHRIPRLRRPLLHGALAPAGVLVFEVGGRIGG